MIKAGDAKDFKGRDLLVRRVEKRNEFRFEEPAKKAVFTDLQRYLAAEAPQFTVDEVVEFFKPLITVLEIPPDMNDDAPEGRLVPGGDPLLYPTFRFHFGNGARTGVLSGQLRNLQ
jgi:hypothetical protein